MEPNTPSNGLVSIIIPVFNREKHIRQAIESALAQTYGNKEIIVVDDGSRDGTAKIVKTFGSSVRYTFRENGGPAAARNTGLGWASGDYIAFLDSDDVWLPDKLSVQVGYLRQHPDIGYAIGNVTYFLDPGQSPPPGFRRELLSGTHTGRLLQVMLARRQVFTVVGAFNDALSTAEDVDWFCRANDLDIAMGICPEVVARIRVHNGNTALAAKHNNQRLLDALRQSVLRKKQRPLTSEEK